MPTTYNGVGTRYVGNKNADSRPANCPHCHRAVVLTSYDTRLWFVVFFIPIIPLARKRIIDQCSSCRRHYVMPLEKWEAGKQLSISGAMGEYRDDPTPEKAVAAHRQLLGYHQTAQADEFGRTMAEQYVDNANVQLYLGDATSHLGRWTKAAEYYQRALALRPDMPEARIAVAQGYRTAGRLDEARQLLDFLEKPGVARLYSAAPLELLANAYQAAGRHPEALELYQTTLREMPAAGQHAGFRKRVRKSEKALGGVASALPKKRFTLGSIFGVEAGSRRTLTIAAVIVGLIALGMIFANYYVREHRTLYVVNAYGAPATVQVAGRTPLQVPRLGQAEVPLPEGSYHVVVTGPIRDELDLNLRADYVDRWFSRPAWVLNLGGNAVLILQQVHYSSTHPPADVSFYTGQKFYMFPTVDHPFSELPQRVQLSNGEHEKILTKLDYARESAVSVMQELIAEKKLAEAIVLGETRLSNLPDDPGLIPAYLEAASAIGDTLHAATFLRGGLTRRPVDIEWHRAYQNLLRREPNGLEHLRSAYDTMLTVEPTNSALLYLRGRLCEHRAEAETFFARASAADPDNPWPLFGSAYNRALTGDWPSARNLLAKASRLAPNLPEITEMFFQSRLALGETVAMEKELREHLASVPMDVMAFRRLTDVLNASGQTEQSRQALEDWSARLGQSNRDGSLTELIHRVRRYVLYSMGAFKEMELDSRGDLSPDGKNALFQACLEQGQLEAAAQQLNPMPPGEEGALDLLALSVAAAATGDTARAADYRARAQSAFQGQGTSGAGVAALLARTTAPTTADLDGFDLNVEQEALLLTALALQYRSHAGEYARMARTLDTFRGFPSQLVQRVSKPLAR